MRVHKVPSAQDIPQGWGHGPWPWPLEPRIPLVGESGLVVIGIPALSHTLLAQLAAFCFDQKINYSTEEPNQIYLIFHAAFLGEPTVLVLHRKSIEMTPLVVRGRLEMPRRYSSGSRGAQETPKSAPGGTQEQARSALERHKSTPEPLGCPFGRHGGSHWRPQGITKASFAGTWPHEGAQKVVQVRVPKRSREWKRKWILK